MAFQMKENSGQLFKAEDRKTDKSPEYEGEFSATCPHCQAQAGGWIKAWVREAKNGKKYFSVALKFKQRKEASQ